MQGGEAAAPRPCDDGISRSTLRDAPGGLAGSLGDLVVVGSCASGPQIGGGIISGRSASSGLAFFSTSALGGRRLLRHNL